MGFLDNLKARLGPAKEKVGDKVGDLAHQHGGKIEQGLDKAARTVDEKTKGKYSDKIQSGTQKAKDTVDRLGHKDAHGPGPTTGFGGTDGTPPPPAH
ncbi:antitoxin [Streptomyces sp. NPDC002690]